MRDNDKPAYCGNGREITTSTGKTGLKIELDLTELGAFLKDTGDEFTRTWKGRDGTEHRCIRLELWPMKPENVTEYKTHSLKVDTWKPDGKGGGARREDTRQAERRELDADEAGGGDALPF